MVNGDYRPHAHHPEADIQLPITSLGPQLGSTDLDRGGATALAPKVDANRA